MKAYLTTLIKRLSLAVAITFICISPSQAIRFNALKGVTQQFVHAHHSPVLGFAALESGLIYNIRFRMVEEPGGLSKSGGRLFINDRGSDPHWIMVKTFFPSPNGLLASKVGTQFNLAEHTDFAFMAELLKFTYAVRSGKAPDINQSYESMANIFMQSEYFANLKNTKDKSNKKNKFKNTVIPLLNAITQAIYNENQEGSIFPKYTVEQIIAAFLCAKTDTVEDMQAYLTALRRLDADHQLLIESPEATLKPLENIDEAIEQISQKLDKVDASINAMASSSNNSGNDAAYMSKNEAIDAIYILGIASNFTNPTPYRNSLINNGHTHFITGVDGLTIDSSRKLFQDCNETALRLLLNLLLFNKETKEFDLSFLGCPHQGEPFKIQRLREFYEKQPFYAASDTSLHMRTEWNRVVSGLNLINGPAIRYIQTDNELDAGFVNTLRVFEKIFQQQFLDAYPQNNLEAQKAAIRQGFINLFTYIAPTKAPYIKIEFDNNVGEFERKDGSLDLCGSMLINVGQDFQVTLYATPYKGATHGHLQDLKILRPDPTVDKRVMLAQKLTSMLSADTAEESIMLLDKATAKLTNQPLYTLFNNPIAGNAESYYFVADIVDTPPSLSQPQEQWLSVVLTSIFNDYAWDDEYMRDLMSIRIARLLGEQKYVDVINNTVRELTWTPSLQPTLLEGLKKLEALHVDTFGFSGEFYGQNYMNHVQAQLNILRDKGLIKSNFSLIIPSYLPIKKLHVNIEDGHSIENLYLLHDLEELVSNVYNLDVPYMPNLKKVNIVGGYGITLTIDPNNAFRELRYAGKVERIDLNAYGRSEELELVNFPQPYSHSWGKYDGIKSLVLSKSVKDLSIFKNIESLEELDMSKMDKKEVDLIPLPNLKRLTLPIGVEKVTGLENVPALQHLRIQTSVLLDLGDISERANLKIDLRPANDSNELTSASSSSGVR